MNDEGKARWNKEEIEKPDAEKSGQQSGRQSEADANEQYREQKQHHDIGQIQIPQQRRSQQCCTGARQHSQSQSLPGGQ